MSQSEFEFMIQSSFTAVSKLSNFNISLVVDVFKLSHNEHLVVLVSEEWATHFSCQLKFGTLQFKRNNIETIFHACPTIDAYAVVCLNLRFLKIGSTAKK
jgi:hypothetical protein